jgi:hypothetical protein
MAPQTVEEIIHALQEHPEWREPLLNALLNDQYRQLPTRADRLEEALARLAEESAKTDQRLAEMAARMEESRRETDEYLRQLSEKADKRFAEMEARIAESNARVDQRLAEMAARMEESLGDRVGCRETDQRLAEMAARMEESRRQTDQRFAEITSDLRALTETVRNLLRRFDSELGSVKGMTLEMLYRDNATTILGKHFRNLRLVDRGQYLQEMLDQHPITDSEWKQLVSTDVMIQGVHRLTGKEYLMVWEVSWVIDDHDVERAADRAEILRHWHANALPVVAGKVITASAHQAAQERGVLVVLDSEVLEQTAPA